MKTKTTHRLQAGFIILSTVFLTFLARGQSRDVLTYHNDNGRTGQYTNESVLSPANVNSANFGKLWSLSADAHVDAEPLRAGGVLIPGVGYRNVVFVVTENDSVYAYDADSSALFWHTNLTASGETASDDRGCGQVSPLIGITAAPVIDRHQGPNGALYAVAMSKNSSGTYFQRLHVLDLATGTNLLAPAVITGTYPGTGANSSGGNVIFDPKQYKERAGLLLLSGIIYTAWASHCDDDPYTGWIMGYDENTLAQRNIINVTPNASRGAIWMGNTAMAADASSNIVFLDANGIFDAALNTNGFPISGDYGNGFMKISPANGGLSVADYFETSNTVSQSSGDEDLGSGGAIVLPYLTDSQGVPRQLAVGAGKDENIYLVDLANMGKWSSARNAIYQQVGGALGGTVFSMPAYFNSTLYYCANSDRLRAFPFQNARLGAMSSQSAAAAGSTGATPSISANGASNGIVWVVQAPSSSIAILQAFAATNVGVQLYTSSQATTNRDHFGTGNKYATPMIANSKVYVGAMTNVAVFGLLNQAPPVAVKTLSFQAQPGNAYLAGVISPEIQVQALNSNGVAVIGAEITVALSAGSGSLGGTVTKITDQSGIAHFNDLTINADGVKYLVATPGYGVTNAATNSTSFTISSPPSQAVSGVTVNPGGSVTIVFGTTPTVPYRVETATNLLSPIWTVVSGSSTNASGTSVTFTDTISAPTAERFYRIVSP